MKDSAATGQLHSPREAFEAAWERAAGDRPNAEVKKFSACGTTVVCMHAPWHDDPNPRVYLETGFSFLAMVRPFALPYRCVLLPRSSFGDRIDWRLSSRDIADWIKWANQIGHIVTFSTFKSGAGFPMMMHAQSFSASLGPELDWSDVLRSVANTTVIAFGEMPHYGSIEISSVSQYLGPALKIAGEDSDEALNQVANKVYELALNYDNLKACNLVVVPSRGQASLVLFIPRRRDGMSIFGDTRWQIAAIEFAGILLCRDRLLFESLTCEIIESIFEHIRISDGDRHQIKSIVDAF